MLESWLYGLLLFKKCGLYKESSCRYRTISFIGLWPKLIERLGVFLEWNHLLDPLQLAKKSVVVVFQLTPLSFMNLIQSVMFLDLTSAFDTINHDCSIDRLHHRCGFRDVVLPLFRSSLPNLSVRNSFSIHKPCPTKGLLTPQSTLPY